MSRQQQQQQMMWQRREQRPLISKSLTENRADHEECDMSSSSLANNSDNKTKINDDNQTNLDRFLEFTTPAVPAQHLPKIIIRRRQGPKLELEYPPYFVLEDLWESFKEWSAYAAGVPLLLNGTDSVTQYYVPYLSAIQLYIDPSRPRGPGEESNTESSRESSDGSNNAVQRARSQIKIADANIARLNRLALRNRPSQGSSSDETDIHNPPGQLVFEYLEHDRPSSREPLADKILVLASRFPALMTYRSCDLSPSSWISVAWYPIYRVPMGPTMQNLDACFLTYHCLSTPSSPGTGTDGLPFQGFYVREFHGAKMSSKLTLPSFGLALYKFKVSNEVNESLKANSLLQEADNWLRRLEVNHPDFRFFISHNYT